MRTMETMALEKIKVYLKFGFNIEVAAKKAIAANPTFSNQIHKIAKELKNKENKEGK